MATITIRKNRQPEPEWERAIDYKTGDVLIDKLGQVGIRTEKHIVRAQTDFTGNGGTLFVLALQESSDLFTLAPPGTSFTVSN
jgi:predicted trehalose synthase